MKRFIKNHPDGFVALLLITLLPIVIIFLHQEGMHFSGYVVMWVHVAIFLYFIIWIAFLKHRRDARRIMSRNTQSDPFNEGDYYNRTGISSHRPHWRSRPWPRPRDQWSTSRGTWDARVPPDRRNRE